ncbi:MAG: MOSC domain-containing protein [Planctomycetes bacterium]|nr:MOSC domain-containing protein [Planctomycetota bacterium]
MSNSIEIVSVNISTEKGTPKRPVEEVIVDDNGIANDAHAGPWHRQVSMLAQESIERFAAEADRSITPGDFAENLTTRGIDLSGVAILDRFQIGDVALEITQIGKECHGDGCAIFREVGRCVMPKEGIFCRVLHGGKIRPGDAVEYIPRPLKIRIITMSDRAASGKYQDKSGPRIREMLEEFFADKRRHVEIEAMILPDDADKLRTELTAARDACVDVVFTTGGTGAGPRDITPETASEICDKIIPGIMENIRIKYGSQKPNALLSRGIAGIAGQTQVYTLPGSSRAVSEYMTEILKTLEHIIFMIHGVDVH